MFPSESNISVSYYMTKVSLVHDRHTLVTFGVFPELKRKKRSAKHTQDSLFYPQQSFSTSVNMICNILLLPGYFSYCSRHSQIESHSKRHADREEQTPSENVKNVF